MSYGYFYHGGTEVDGGRGEERFIMRYTRDG
jgi:hypothetical protein